MAIQTITVNGNIFPVLRIHDVSMIPEAQEKHGIQVKTWRVETHIPEMRSGIFTPKVIMAVFFSAHTFDIANPIQTPIALVEKRIGMSRILKAYRCDEYGYFKRPDFSHGLNGFIGCTMMLNLCFYLLEKMMDIKTSSLHSICLVDKSYLDRDQDDDEPFDTSLEHLFLQDI